MSHPAGRRDSSPWYVTSLPPLLFGLALSLLLLAYVPLRAVVWGGATPLRGLKPAALPLALCLVSMASIAGGAIFGLWRRLPAWSHTWTSTAIVAVAFVLMILGDDRPYLISPAADVAAALVLVAALAGIALVAARRSAREASLVAVGFGAAFALAVSFTSVAGPIFRVDMALCTAPAGLVFALLIAALGYGSKAIRWAVLGTSAVIAAVLIWRYDVAVVAALSSPPEIRFLYPLLGILTIGLLAPVILALWLRPRSKSARSAL